MREKQITFTPPEIKRIEEIIQEKNYKNIAELIRYAIRNYLHKERTKEIHINQDNLTKIKEIPKETK